MCELFCVCHFSVAARALLFEHSSSTQSVSSGRYYNNHQTNQINLVLTNSHNTFIWSCLCREAKAMYSCEAEHSHELSFQQGAHFLNGESGLGWAHVIKTAYTVCCFTLALELLNSVHSCSALKHKANSLCHIEAYTVFAHRHPCARCWNLNNPSSFASCLFSWRDDLANNQCSRSL